MVKFLCASGQVASLYQRLSINSKSCFKKYRRDPFHRFPDHVKNFEKDGVSYLFRGGDGKMRTKLEIPGEYGGYKGAFEFIKESNNEISHHVFIPYRG